MREQAANSVTNHLMIIEDLIMKGYKHLEEYKNEAESTRENIQDMLSMPLFILKQPILSNFDIIIASFMRILDNLQLVCIDTYLQK